MEGSREVRPTLFGALPQLGIEKFAEDGTVRGGLWEEGCVVFKLTRPI